MSEILSTEKFLIQEMTWPEVKEALKVTEMAIAPVSSTEQHGPHCPLNTDALIGFEIACRAVRKLHSETGKRVLIAPMMPIGLSPHHMSFPGTITLTPETLIKVVTEICLSLSHHGFKKIVVVNSHGGNNAVLDAAARKIFEKSKAMIYVTTAWLEHVDPDKNLAKKTPKAGPQGTSHACETETSLLMALEKHVRTEKIPKTIQLPKYPIPDFVGWSTAKYRGVNFTGNWNVEDLNEDGYLGDPSVASSETGKVILDYYSTNLAEFLKQLSNI